MEFLEKTYEYDYRDFNLTFLKVAPEFDVLRSESRFQALMEKMNFPE